MSWVSDSVSDMYKKNLEKLKVPYELFGARNGYTDFIDSEIQKADLRGAEVTSFLRGLPIVGGLVGGVEGVQQLEDLYNNTGKIPAYPGSSGPGAQGLAQAGVGVARKIEEGLNDLGEYYSGDTNLHSQFESINGYSPNPVVKTAPKKMISKYGGF